MSRRSRRAGHRPPAPFLPGLSFPLPRLAAAVAVGFALAALGGCASDIDDAASVGDERIERAEFEDELRDLMGNDGFVDVLRSSGFEIGDSDSTVSSEVAAVWLGFRLRHAAGELEVTERGLEISEADRKAARTSLESGFGGPEVFADFVPRLADRLLEREAAYQALRTAMVAEAETIDEEDARIVYEANRDTFGACESEREVAHILVETEAEAGEVLEELDNSGDFAELAQERSTDPGSGAEGGSLGCLGANEFVPEFAAAAESAELDEVVGPVETQFGFHLILVTAWEAPTFEDMAEQLVSDLQAAGADSAAEALTSAIVSARLSAEGVRIDPRYGTWDDGLGRVLPPEVPEARDERDPEPETPTELPGG